MTLSAEQTGLVQAFSKYQKSLSADDLQNIHDYIRILSNMSDDMLDFVKAHLQVEIEKSVDDASARFSYYDILTFLCEKIGLIQILSAETLRIFRLGF